MAIHDYIIDDQTGANFRVDINNALSAIVSNNSNATEPTTTYAFMWWADTTAGLLKQRNSSNTDWVDILDLATGKGVSMSINDLIDATTAILNLGLGNNALINIIASFNTAVGNNALRDNISGAWNTAVGDEALVDNLGSQNTAIGFRALKFAILGSFNTAIGINTSNSASTDTYAITMGHGTRGISSNYFTFGKGTASDRVYNEFTANAVWTRVSDERVKKDIKTNEVCGLGFINDLRTVTYKFKAPSELAPEMREFDENNDIPSHDKPMYGFIAQEVKRALDKHGIKNFAGHHQIKDGKDNLQGISYEMFILPLTKAVQELSVKIDEKDTIINDLIKRVESLEAK
jgi:hypothetical protein